VEGTTNYSSLAHSVVTLAITDAAILLAARWLKRRRARQEVAAPDAERSADLTRSSQATDRSGACK
jgi:hypothetical protein